MPAPSVRSADAVDCTSAESSRPRTRERPGASAANVSALWLMDLSPGTRTRPPTLSTPNNVAAPAVGRTPRRDAQRLGRSGPPTRRRSELALVLAAVAGAGALAGALAPTLAPALATCGQSWQGPESAGGHPPQSSPLRVEATS